MYDEPHRVGPLLIGDQPLPHDADMEASVLSCYLQDPVKVSDQLSDLTEESFYVPNNMILFRAMRELTNKRYDWDFAEFCNYLYDLNVFDQVGGMEEMRNLRNRVPTIANVDRYAGFVANYHTARKLIRAAANLQGLAFETPAADINSLMDSAEKEILDISRTKNDVGFQHISTMVDGALKNMVGVANNDPECCGLGTGYRGLNDLIMGFRAEYIVFAARPSIGKTALWSNIFKRIASYGHPVGNITLEMSAEKLTQRYINEHAGLNPRNIFHGKIPYNHWYPEAEKAAGYISALPIYFYDAQPQIGDIKRRCRELVSQHGVKIIGIDYLQLMRGDGKFFSREEEVASISWEIKSMVKELGIPIIVLAQLNRGAEGGGSGMSSIRGSGAIEQDADIIGVLERDRETDSEEAAAVAEREEGIKTKLVICKNRDGATGIVKLLFFPHCTRFDEETRISNEDIPGH